MAQGLPQNMLVSHIVARESSQMASIYSHAHVVLSADRSTDSACGIFHDRGVRTSRVINLRGMAGVTAALLYSYTRHFFTTSPYENEPLCRRGWAFQERQLARRILHYTSLEMCFECKESTISEEGIRLTSQHTKSLRELLQNPPSSLSCELDNWSRLVTEFGRRRLTKLKDKLPAMSGLAKIYQDRLGGPQYVAGLWSNALVRGLAWSSSDGWSPFDCYTGPSWSWPSYDGLISSSAGSGSVEIARVAAWSVTLQEPVNPFGEVTSAWIRLTGPVVPLTPRTDRGRTGNAPRLCWVRTPYSKTANSQCFLDHNKYLESGAYRDWDMRIMPLHRVALPQGGHSHVRGEPPATSEYFALVVRVFNAKRGAEAVIRRVGYMMLRDDTEDMAGMIDNKHNWTTMTLV
ncbi:hypothetical protein BD289DRAFT_193440 [Coniella lustricola]|uniref:Heterokaryon incompatibility domain-containing protein n=1 Tax=Coniella lustricola TaxID=2025994 RepID=A0A2T3ALY8_9PEZI|nr:hypothetical protein BD289DRAFT_193440 [Coniella lustricola]